MRTEITLGPGLDAHWQRRIQRQIDFKLSTSVASIRYLHAKLESFNDSITGEELFRYEMTATLFSDKRTSVQLTGAMPNISIADATDRLRRSITRAVSDARSNDINSSRTASPA